MDTHTPKLLKFLRSGASESGLAWLDQSLAQVRAQPGALPRIFAAVSRKLGRGALLPSTDAPPATASLETGYGPLSLNSWCLDDAGRALLLLATGAAAQMHANNLYSTGELRERIGCLRCLALLPGADVARPSLEDACRTNSVPLFEAAVCENPYASHWLEPLLFNQSVLKAAFMDVRLARIERLDARTGSELTRMLTSYVSERLAAGRTVPFDVWPVLARHPQPSTWDYLQTFSSDPFPGHRYHAALALNVLATSDHRLATAARELLAARLPLETEARVRAALTGP